MRKKIYDIVPPNKIGKEEVKPRESIEEVEIEVKAVPAFHKEKFRKPKKFSGGSLLIVGIVLVIGVIIGTYFLTDTKSEVKISPKTEQLNAEKDVVITINEDYKKAEGDERFVLTGKVLSEEKEYTTQIASTGSAGGGGMAKGRIKIFAKHTPSTPLPLIKGTRFVSEKNGKTYRIQNAITIPAGSNGEPGSVEVDVLADGSGDEYNIDSSKFSVPGFKEQGNAFFDTTWAEVVTPITGGAKSTEPAVSENDILGAKDKFKNQQLEGIKNQLISALPSDYLLIDNSTLQDVSGLSVKAKAGDKVGSFDVSGTIKTTMIAVKKDDLNSFLSSIAGSGQSLNYGDLKVSATKMVEKSDSFELNLAVSANYSKIGDVDSLTRSILGKSKEEALSILAKDKNIEKVDVNINPLWKNVISANKDNVIVKIEPIVK